MKAKKLLALLFVVVLACGMFAACKDDPDEPGTSQPTAEWTYTGDNTFYFRGSTFIPKNPRDYTDAEKEAAAAVPPDYSVEEEAMMNKVAEVEERYGVTIVCDSDTSIWLMDVSEFAAMVASGEIPVDIFHSELGFARDLYLTDYIEPMSNLEAIDLSDDAKWGGENKLAMTSYKGEVWGIPCIGSNYAPVPQIYYGVLLYNHDTYDSYNLDKTPEEMLEDGTWTFDGFLELLPQVTNNSETDTRWALQYPPVEATGNIVFNAILANGGNKVIQNADGKYVCGIAEPNAILAMEWVQQITNLGEYTVKQDASKELDNFNENRVTFLLTDGNRIFREIAKLIPAEDYSWMPFPYGPDAEYGQTSSAYITSADSVMTIFRNEDPERSQAAAILFNDIVDTVSIAGSSDYNEYLFRNYFAEGDEDSFNIYLELSQSTNYNYALEYGVAEGRFVNLCKSVVTGDISPSSTVPQLVDIINGALDKSMN